MVLSWAAAPGCQSWALTVDPRGSQFWRLERSLLSLQTKFKVVWEVQPHTEAGGWGNQQHGGGQLGAGRGLVSSAKQLCP